MGEYPGDSPYNYVLGNPISLIDPDGMAPCCVVSAQLSVRGQTPLITSYGGSMSIGYVADLKNNGALFLSGAEGFGFGGGAMADVTVSVFNELEDIYQFRNLTAYNFGGSISLDASISIELNVVTEGVNEIFKSFGITVGFAEGPFLGFYEEKQRVSFIWSSKGDGDMQNIINSEEFRDLLKKLGVTMDDILNLIDKVNDEASDSESEN